MVNSIVYQKHILKFRVIAAIHYNHFNITGTGTMLQSKARYICFRFLTITTILQGGAIMQTKFTNLKLYHIFWAKYLVSFTHFHASLATKMTGQIYLFIYLTSPQGQGHHNSVSQLLWARITYPPCQLSLWQETGVPGENPRLSAERWLYSFHMRTGFESTLRWTLLGIELGTSEVKGEWSDHYATEAPMHEPR